MSAPNAVRDAAHEYIDHGLAVVILKPREKTPNPVFMPHGLHDATDDHDVIEQCFAAEPESNIGLRTGEPWFDALDFDGDPLDPDHALNRAMPLSERPQDDPVVKGPTVVTGSGGAQVYLSATGYGNRARLLPGLDWRGRNGYVVAVPSIHPSGQPYRLKCPDDPEYGALAPIVSAPAWVLALFERPRHEVPVAPFKAGRDTGAYGRHALESECGRIALAPVGQRNDQLNTSSFALGSLIAAGALDVDQAIDALLVAAVRSGLETTEARRTIASGIKSGAAQPRVMT